MDRPRDCYTEWCKSEREKQILYINIYVEYTKSIDDIICQAEIESEA